MKKVIGVLILLFLVQACSLEKLFVYKELNRTYVVRYDTYTKHYRAYFVRTDLEPIVHKRKYLFLYHTRQHTLAILLRKDNRYIVYTLSKPDTAPKIVATKAIRSYGKLRRLLASYGYRIVDRPEKYSYRVSVKPMRYKGVKTYMIETIDMRKLTALYKEAIDTYDTSKVYEVEEIPPQDAVVPYLLERMNETPDTRHSDALRRILQRLRYGTHPLPADTASTTRETYNRYLHDASLEEIDAYLDTLEKRHLDETPEYRKLRQHRQRFYREKLLGTASLETLIEIYKHNNDPIFKRRIMERIKYLQQTR